MSSSDQSQCPQDLKIAHQRLEELAHQTESWFWETDENHVFKFFTDNVEQFTSFSKESLLGSSRLELAQASKEPHWEKHAKTLINRYPFKDFRYVREGESGDLRNLNISGWPVFDDQGNFIGYRGTGRDETNEVMVGKKRVQREEQLLQEIEKQRRDLSLVLENLSQSVLWFDETGVIHLKNSQTSNLLGFSEKEYSRVYTMRHHLRLMAERGDFGDVDVEKEVEKHHARLCVELTEPTNYRIHLKSSDRYLQVDLRLLDDGTRILTHTDVTEEAKAERLLVERDAMLKQVVGNIDYGIVLMDKDLNVGFANTAFCELLDMDVKFLDTNPSMEDVFTLMRNKKLFDFPDWSPAEWAKYLAFRRREITQGSQAPTERYMTNGKTVIETCVSLANGRRMMTFSDITEHKAREETLSTVINNLDYGILFMDEDLNGEIINDRFAEMWNMTPEFVASKPTFAQLVEQNRHSGVYPVDGNDEEAWQDYVQTRIKAVSEAKEGTRELVLENGTYLNFSIVKLPGDRRMATYFDVTDLKKMDKDLRQANQELGSQLDAMHERDNLFNTLINNIDYGAVIVGSDMKLELANRKFAELMSLDENWLAKSPDMKTVLDKMQDNRCTSFTGDSRAEWEVYRDQVLVDIHEDKVPVRERHRGDGRTIIHSCISLEGGRRLLTYFDATNMKKMEKALQAANNELGDRLDELDERQAVFESLIDNIDYGALILNTDQSVNLTNKSFREMMILDDAFFANEPTMRDVLNQMHINNCTGLQSDDEKEWEEYREAALLRYAGGDAPAVERSCRNGKTIVHSCIALPDGMHLLTYLDVTEMKERETQLESMQHDLAQANEMLEDRVEQRTAELRKTQATLVQKERKALLGDLVSSLCHELRNPLNALNTSMFIVRRKVEGDFPKLKNAFDRSERTIERCKHILDDLYSYALTDDIITEAVEISPWMQEQIQKTEVPDNVEFKFDIAEGLPVCQIDKIQLSRALAKLTANAIQAMVEGDEREGKKLLTLTAAKQDDRVEINITDTGPGMDDDTLKSALEPLFSTRGFGVGLGLPIADQVLRRHNGGLDILTKPGQGTTITVWLPANPVLAQAA